MHVPFEGPGLFEDWFRSRGMELRTWKLFRENTLPEPEKVDFLLLMGGPMNIYEYGRYPFLKREKQCVAECIRHGRKVLGICLGAQIIADVLGQKTYPNPEREIGWFPVTGKAPGLPESFIPFHWHSETFDLPAGAELLASSAACLNQAFRYGENVLALQFHLEITAPLMEGMLNHVADDPVTGLWIQGPENIRRGLIHTKENGKILYALLDEFTGLQ